MDSTVSNPLPHSDSTSNRGAVAPWVYRNQTAGVTAAVPEQVELPSAVLPVAPPTGVPALTGNGFAQVPGDCACEADAAPSTRARAAASEVCENMRTLLG